ncbi:ATP-binding protein [Leadbettera azotonutricia]|uniref:ATP-binding protein n=1 Tax=Leadbettera azotonutricia TaxID=150829 RepID=UPI001FDF88F7|nr:ATP-binding protein [Leadbettera azotonutricia]
MKIRNSVMIPAVILIMVAFISISAVSSINYNSTVHGVMESEMNNMLNAVDNQLVLTNRVIAITLSALDKKNLVLARILANTVAEDDRVLEIEHVNQLAERLGVDEIHVTDEKGVLRWGNRPQFYGLDFSTTDQTRPFMRMLEEPDFELAQEPTPRGSDGRMFQYVGVARRDKPGIVQVGISIEPIDEIRRSMSIQRGIANMIIGRQGGVFILDTEGNIAADNRGILFGKNIRNEVWADPMFESHSGTLDFVYGLEKEWGRFRRSGSSIIVVSMPKSELFSYISRSMLFSSGFGLAVVLVLAAVLYLVLTRLVIRPLGGLNHDMAILLPGSRIRKDKYSETEEFFLLCESINKMLERLDISDGLIRDLRITEEELHRASQAKSDFLSNMSHEMRTPMNAIIGMTSIAKSTSDISRKDYCLAKIEEASTHLLGVINDILDMSKIEADKFELSSTEFDFAETVQKGVNVLTYRMEEKKQNFSLNLDKKIPPFLIGDDQRLMQVVTNLLSNAVKFTPENGGISVNAELINEKDTQSVIQIDVRDSGIGMSKEQQGRLFSSFQQADSGISRKYGGTGLGLAISKRIVEMMGGRIWVESEQGKGSVFSFTVNFERGSPAKEKLPSAGKTPGTDEKEVPAEVDDFSGHSILLAEDVDINREIVQALLEPTGLSIDCAENGQVAVKLFAESPEKYSLVFMDVQMPEMDGYEATRQIRAFEAERLKGLEFAQQTPQQQFKAIPIIAMSANVFKEDIERCLAAGMNDHVGKPLDFEIVLEKLRRYL